MATDQQATKHRKLCRFCGVTFSSKQALEKHVDRHKKGLICSVCGRLFERKYLLAMHVKKYADEVPYECDSCDKKFHIESRRDAHMLTHSEENPFSCNLCGKHFLHKHALSRHQEIHVGRKLFKCKVCKKPFSQKGNMKRHVLTHIGAKPFLCEVCGKEFSQRGHLNMHRLIHDGRKPFACDICGEQFSTRRTFKGHYDACKQRSGGAVEVIKFFHRSSDKKSKSITISVGDRILGCIDIECNMNVFTEPASNTRSNEKRGAAERHSEGNALDSSSNGASDESCRTYMKRFYSESYSDRSAPDQTKPNRIYSESDVSDFTLKNAPPKSYKKSKKLRRSRLKTLDSGATNATLCTASTTEFYSTKGKNHSNLNSNNKINTEIYEKKCKRFDGETIQNEAPRESCKANNSSELLPSDGRALHFIKLTTPERAGEMNSTESYIANAKYSIS